MQEQCSRWSTCPCFRSRPAYDYTVVPSFWLLHCIGDKKKAASIAFYMCNIYMHGRPHTRYLEVAACCKDSISGCWGFLSLSLRCAMRDLLVDLSMTTTIRTWLLYYGGHAWSRSSCRHLWNRFELISWHGADRSEDNAMIDTEHVRTVVVTYI